MTLQELKDNYAQEQGFLEWEELHMACQFEGKNLHFAKHIDAVIILAQQEALKNVSKTIDIGSITSENNLIK